MNSVWKGVKCKQCGEEDRYDVSSGYIYRVNGREDVEYTGIECYKCGKLNLLALDVIISDSYEKEDVERSVEDRAKESLGYLGKDIEKVREIIRKREVIVSKEESVILYEEAKEVKSVGVFM